MPHRFWFRLCTILIVCLLFAPTRSAETDADAPDEARWKHGELLAPLPTSAEKRFAAIEQAKAFGLARPKVSSAVKSLQYRSQTVGPLAPVGRVARAPVITEPSAPDPARAQWLQSLYQKLRVPEASPADLEATRDAGKQSDPSLRALAASTFAPNSVPNSFDGIDDTGFDPGAPDIAVGPSHLLLATTDRFAVMDKCGSTLLNVVFRAHFNQPASRSYYTPKVIFDSWDARWIMLYIGTETNFSASYLYIAVSLTVDPLDGWTLYAVPTNVIFPGLKDGLSIGVTPETIYISYNQFNLTTFAFERVMIMEVVKAEAYSGAPLFPGVHNGMLNPGDATLAFSVHAADMRTYSGAMYFANSKPGGTNFFTIWSLVGAPGASVLTGYNVPVGAYLPPPDMVQPDASLVDAGDARVRDAVYASGKVYMAYGRDDGGDATVEFRQIDVVTLSPPGIFLSTANEYAYPVIDIDENDDILFAYCSTGAGLFLSLEYYLFQMPLTVLDTGGLAVGLANFSSGASPSRWGPYIGAALDPADGRTFWTHGPYASNAPANSWTTRVGAVTNYTPSNLAVAAVGTTYVAGYEGGPFSPEHIDVEISNTGATAATWNVSNLPVWLSIAERTGTLDAGDSELLSFAVNALADGFPQGSFPENLIFANCTGTGGAVLEVTLAVGIDASCSGARLSLAPPVSAVGGSVDPASTELGAFVTAMRDIHLCAIGIEAGLGVPQNVTANVYDADGTTRGGLLWSSLPFLLVDGDYGLRIIPIDATLSACAEYDIAVEFGGSVSWSYWNDPATGVAPFDAGGLVRVRDAEVDGNAADTRLPRIVLFTDTGTCANTTDLAAGAGEGVLFTANDARGLFVNPERAMRLCSVAIEGDFVVGARLTARVYKATAAVRTALLAEGTLLVTSPFYTFHDVPISQVLLGGSQYDIEIEWEDTGAWTRYTSPPAILEYTVANTITVYGAENYGAVTGILPRLRLAWGDDPAGVPFDLAKLSGPALPPLSSAGALSHGAYITSLIDQEVYSIGVTADIPDNVLVTAYLYEATGTTRGALVSSATTKSHGGGMRWHDIPVSASLSVLGEYDIQFSAPGVAEWPYWLDSPGLPYDSYGTLRVRDAEANGIVGTSFLAHMRVHSCNATLTAIGDDPQHAPMMLEPPAPNPTTGLVRFGYAVDESGVVEVAVYDVAGRRVAQVARKSNAQPGRDAVDFDTSKLASGVYFVKLTTSSRSTSRKFVVTH